MPRRRKNLGGNPFRKTANSKEVVVPGVASREEPTTTHPSMCGIQVDQDELFTSISEMFSDLDPDVVYLMLSECDFKVENAMDCLLELSATDARKQESSSSSLLASENQETIAGSDVMEKCPEKENEDSKMYSVLDTQLTEDFDCIIENAFETLEPPPDGQVSSSLPLQDVRSLSDRSECINSDSSTVTSILSVQNKDLNNEILENSASTLSSDSLTSHSVLNESKSFLKDDTLTLEDNCPEDCLLSSSLNVANDSILGFSNLSQRQEELLESECVQTQFSQAPVDLDANEPQPPLNLSVQNPELDLLVTDGDQKSTPVPNVLVPSEEFTFKPYRPTELPPKGKEVNCCPVLTPFPLLLPPCSPSQFWSPVVPAFDPIQGSHGFVTPVVTTAAHWRPISYTFPSPVISHTSQTKVWRNKEGTSAYQIQESPVSQAVRKKKTSYVGLVLVLLRGLPGSGKSFLARTLREDNPGGVILSTDDYFYINGQYQFDVKYLGEAHEWNEHRAKEAFEKKVSPIIIDNTNLQAWEMRPYVALSQKYKYKVHFREPDTWWKFKPRELARRNIHGVNKEKITRMLERYQRFVSVPIIMSSLVPEKIERVELCAYSCEDRSTSPKDNEDTTCAKEENVLSSSLKHLELTEEKKLEVTDENVLLENVSFLLHADLDRGRREISGMNHNIQSAVIQEGPDMYFSDSESRIQVKDKSEKEEQVEMASEKQCSETDIASSVERVSPGIYYDENNQEDCDLAKTIPLQNENFLLSEVLGERTTVKKKTFERQKDKSTLEKFPRHELSNFVGDWPGDKTIGQRTKRNRKTEKVSSVQSDKMGNHPQSHKVLGNIVSLDVDCIQQRRSPHGNVEDDKKSWCDDASESFSSCKYDVFTNTEKNISNSFSIVGDWPSYDPLAQRQRRSRMPKARFSEPDLKFGIRDSINTEEFMDEDVQEMEKILMAGNSWSAGVSEEDKTEMSNPTPVMAKSLTIDCLELALPPEFALQLSELFGPVGVDSGSLTVEDCVVHIDLNLAKVIHERWKESVMERQRQEEISRGRLMRDPSLFGHVGLHNPEQKSSQRTGKKLLKTLAASEMLPLFSHWNTQNKRVSLREIMSEEIAIQEKENLKRESFMFEKDFATKLKEKQLFEIFPTINQNFLMDIFQDHNCCLEQTVQFLNCVLEGDPVKTVVAQEFAHQNENVTSQTAQKPKEKKVKKSRETDDIPSELSSQDFEHPMYDDYRAEAFLHQQKRMECYIKAKEAYRMGRKNVATFYAQQGSLHERKMKEANHLAAVEIFEKVNASLLPENVLDLHGLRVDEAIAHLMTVLQQKAEEFRQNGGKPYLSVITGRGNHSQGGVARIKPAVIKYLTSHSFRFSEIKPGCLKVMLK
ncbi:NEDD4-binding protein 2 isoform X5 [Loxodonta africana]|uniref:NEDD4-binding protein 2 isoform X5 n=1 Tax=Loxodonta africana TaxID=9785 RepID=UPI000C811E41|nr:NEDD4-binding protein 2 isoform X4 [Loxodonta africana]